jgi:hypothetical protein
MINFVQFACRRGATIPGIKVRAVPMDNDIFRAFCVKVANEKDPEIVELLKRRLRLLLVSEESYRPDALASADPI